MSYIRLDAERVEIGSVKIGSGNDGLARALILVHLEGVSALANKRSVVVVLVLVIRRGASDGVVSKLLGRVRRRQELDLVGDDDRRRGGRGHVDVRCR